MSNLARKQYQYQPVQQPEKEIKRVKRHAKITPGEKILAFLFVAFLAVMSIQIISANAQMYEVNTGVEDVKTAIQEQEKVNNELEAQIKEMTKYEAVKEVADKMGLGLDGNNVKVGKK
ncbi:cell division protein FtsL [Lederbergia sp. NSJ-179]|uniref:cell division protein FtsL n=1 Tax=Lederbergia sp. NSJ-179 TaxID=2931402 RepID=UPI001FD26257|nr:cell division protein FtsL [Lederbergia sp. NSJ-179]MCJ7839546.1 cell division protein FtsL [Lederbergia sp. NSJ-179]